MLLLSNTLAAFFCLVQINLSDQMTFRAGSSSRSEFPIRFAHSPCGRDKLEIGLTPGYALNPDYIGTDVRLRRTVSFNYVVLPRKRYAPSPTTSLLAIAPIVSALRDLDLANDNLGNQARKPTTLHLTRIVECENLSCAKFISNCRVLSTGTIRLREFGYGISEEMREGGDSTQMTANTPLRTAHP